MNKTMIDTWTKKMLWVFLTSFLISLLGLNIFLSQKIYYLEAWVSAQKSGALHKHQQNLPFSISNMGNNKEVDPFNLHRTKRSPAKLCKRLRRCRTQLDSNRRQVGCHLVGTAEQGIRNTYFRWQNPNSRSISKQISTCYIPTIPSSSLGTNPNLLIKRMRIETPGYYLVYAQVTFCTYGYYNPGFETVVCTNHGTNTNEEWGCETLLSSAIKQVQRATNSTSDCEQDSAYHSGYFHLTNGQALGVRRILANVQNFRLDETRAYFGAILLGHD